jgi:hypothetical protein
VIAFPFALICENKQIVHKKEINTEAVPIAPETVLPNVLPKKMLIKKPTNGANNKSNIVVLISELSF